MANSSQSFMSLVRDTTMYENVKGCPKMSFRLKSESTPCLTPTLDSPPRRTGMTIYGFLVFGYPLYPAFPRVDPCFRRGDKAYFHNNQTVSQLPSL
jgi:hypothetical protein